MSKKTGKTKDSFDDFDEREKQRKKDLAAKRKKYREWVAKNPFYMTYGMELDECESCCCWMTYEEKNKKGYDFCFDCRGSKDCRHSNYDPNFGNCCFCYDPRSTAYSAKEKKKIKRKKLTFFQQQRLYWEEVKDCAEEWINKIKDDEDTDGMRTAKEMEDYERRTWQELEWKVINLTDQELKELIKKRTEELNKIGEKQLKKKLAKNKFLNSISKIF